MRDGEGSLQLLCLDQPSIPHCVTPEAPPLPKPLSSLCPPSSTFWSSLSELPLFCTRAEGLQGLRRPIQAPSPAPEPRLGFSLPIPRLGDREAGGWSSGGVRYRAQRGKPGNLIASEALSTRLPGGPCPPRTLGTHVQKALGARQVISPTLEAKKLRLKKVE